MTPPSFVRENVMLAPFTTFGIGGPARWFAQPADMDELLAALAFSQSRGLDARILGGGSNLLVADSGIDALAIRLSPGGFFADISRMGPDETRWRVGAAASLQALVGAAGRAGLAGMESLAGIPGSVGGAVAMNSGGKEGGIGRFVVGAECVSRTGHVQFFPASELGFRYRKSRLAGLGAIATGFVFEFAERADPEDLLQHARRFAAAKKAAQPVDRRSAGCVFRNPPGESAGALLDRAGCKGLREGGAEVSGLHANFIVNSGGASAADVAKLAATMRARVEDAFAIALEPEIRFWGDFGGIAQFCIVNYEF